MEEKETYVCPEENCDYSNGSIRSVQSHATRKHGDRPTEDEVEKRILMSLEEGEEEDKETEAEEETKKRGEPPEQADFELVNGKVKPIQKFVKVYYQKDEERTQGYITLNLDNFGIDPDEKVRIVGRTDPPTLWLISSDEGSYSISRKGKHGFISCIPALREFGLDYVKGKRIRAEEKDEAIEIDLSSIS